MKKGFKLIENPRFNVLNSDELNSVQGGFCLCNARYNAPCLCDVKYTPPCLCNSSTGYKPSTRQCPVNLFG